MVGNEETENLGGKLNVGGNMRNFHSPTYVVKDGLDCSLFNTNTVCMHVYQEDMESR